MELHDYLRVIRKRWRTIAAAVLAVLAVAAVLTLTSPKVYEARTQLFVSTSSGSDATDLLQGNTFTQQRVKSYADLITTPEVLDPVIEELGLGVSSDTLAANISASAALDTVLIDVLVRNEDPALAARIADAVGKQFALSVSDLERVSAKSDSPVKISVVRPPAVPSAPVSPRPVRNLGVGLVLGLLVGLGLALLRDLLDTSVRTERDVKSLTDAPVLGTIMLDPDGAKNPLITQSPHGVRSEAFRTLRTNLQFVDAATHMRSITFTSSLPGEGKTTTTANLAISLAATGSRVCLVEADLRRPRLLRYLGMEGSVGLTDVLIGRAELQDVLQPYGRTGISVLGAGQLPPNPSELLGSDSMQRTMERLESTFDYVLVDAPPLLPVTDAAVLSTITGGIVIIVGCGVVRREQVERALQSLQAVNGDVLGIVANRVPSKGADAETYYYRDGYAPEPSPRTRRERTKERRHKATV